MLHSLMNSFIIMIIKLKLQAKFTTPPKIRILKTVLL